MPVRLLSGGQGFVPSILMTRLPEVGLEVVRIKSYLSGDVVWPASLPRP